MTIIADDIILGQWRDSGFICKEQLKDPFLSELFRRKWDEKGVAIQQQMLLHICPSFFGFRVKHAMVHILKNT